MPKKNLSVFNGAPPNGEWPIWTYTVLTLLRDELPKTAKIMFRTRNYSLINKNFRAKNFNLFNKFYTFPLTICMYNWPWWKVSQVPLSKASNLYFYIQNSETNSFVFGAAGSNSKVFFIIAGIYVKFFRYCFVVKYFKS